MGVKDLWQLLAPIGRRVSIETLEGKVLAIDASVWIVQFIKALRDDSGNMQKNAHIIGTIRRILKLLYHKIKPVFVFDGATPTLKLRTVQARRERKSGHERDQRLVAQRILMSQIKQNMIKAKLSKDILKSVTSSAPTAEGLYSSTFKPLKGASQPESDEVKPSVSSQERTNESNKEGISTTDGISNAERKSIVAKATSSSSSSSSSSALVKQEPVEIEDVEWEDGPDASHGKALNKKKLGTDDSSNDEGGYDSEDDIDLDLPENGADLDVKALASLPSHLRKDVIEAARRKERIKSRSTYIPIADDPAMYSQTQIANFLKTSHLNKKIAKAQKLVDEEEDGGKCIAADGSRKYIMFDKSNDRDAAVALDELTRKRYPKNAEFDWLDDINGNHSDDSNKSGKGDKDDDEWKDDKEISIMESPKKKRLVKLGSSPSSSKVAARPTTEENSYDSDGDGGGFLLPEQNFKAKESAGTSKRVTFGDFAFASDLNEMDGLRQSYVDREGDDDTNNSDGPTDVVGPADHSKTQNVVKPSITTTDPSPPLPPTQEASKNNGEDVASDIDDVDWESDDGDPVVPLTPAPAVVSDSNVVVKKYADDYIYDGGSDDEWEPTPAAVSRVHSSSNHVNPQQNDNVIDRREIDAMIPTNYQISDGSSKQLLSEDVARRAVSMASGMADWAGRAVQRALKEHISSSHTASSKSIADKLQSQSSPLVDRVDPSDREFLSSSPLLGATMNSQVSDVKKSTPLSDQNIKREESVTEAAENSILPIEVDPQSHQNQLLQTVGEMSKEELETALRDEEMYEDMARRSRAMNMRDAEGMTDEMRDDVIALLNVFELPYMIAPYEAEAQCAVLEQLGLVDGTVTEDSDAFLFGAKTVYRNIFNDKKYVEAYLSSDASTELGIDREDFVALAFFLGSDYTEGISGIGVVNSLEILQAFPVKSDTRVDLTAEWDTNGDERRIADKYAAGVERGLGEFKTWVQSFEPAEYVNALLQRRCDQQVKAEEELRQKDASANKVAKESNNEDDESDEEEIPTKKRKGKGKGQKEISKKKKPSKLSKDNIKQESASPKVPQSREDDIFGVDMRLDENEEKVETTLEEKNSKLIAYTDKHRSGRMSWKIPGVFPDRRVVDAYLNPAANRDHTPFTWPIPKLHRVRKYCAEMLGWTEGQMDTHVDPVVRRLMEKTIQPRIDSHFMTYQHNSRFAKVASVRLTTAISQITGKSLVPTVQRSPPTKKPTPRKRNKKSEDVTNTDPSEST